MPNFLKTLFGALPRIKRTVEWSVDFAERGREGYVYYREETEVVTFYWEFGGGDVVAIVSSGNENEWKRKYPWTDARRRDILRRVADEVIRQKAPSSRADIDEHSGNIYIR